MESNNIDCAQKDQYCCDGVCYQYYCCAYRPSALHALVGVSHHVIVATNLFDTLNNKMDAETTRNRTRRLILDKNRGKISTDYFSIGHVKDKSLCKSEMSHYTSSINGNVSLSAESFVSMEADSSKQCFDACTDNVDCMAAVFDKETSTCAHLSVVIDERVCFWLD